MRFNDTIEVFDGSGNVRPEIKESHPRTARRLEELESTDLAGERIEAGPFDYTIEEDPQGSLKEALLRNAEADPAPDVSDEELYRRWKETHDG